MKAKIEKLYLSYVNDFLTTERFAEYYNMDISKAYRLIKIGRKLNSKWDRK